MKLPQMPLILTAIVLWTSSLLSATPALANQTQAGPAQELTHAKELLGKYFDRSAARYAGLWADRSKDLKKYVGELVASSLNNRFKPQTKAITRTILQESARHGFDPIFLVAFIQNESSFNPEARGSVGELGLMQITPDTARWFTAKVGMPYAGKNTLKNPIENIKIGCAYLSYLRKHFEFHGRLYLAAYNMGPRNVDRALEKQIWPEDYASRVMQRYVGFYRGLASLN